MSEVQTVCIDCGLPAKVWPDGTCQHEDEGKCLSALQARVAELQCEASLREIKVRELESALRQERARAETVRPAALRVLTMVRSMTATMAEAQLWADVVEVCAAVVGKTGEVPPPARPADYGPHYDLIR